MKIKGMVTPTPHLKLNPFLQSLWRLLRAGRLTQAAPKSTTRRVPRGHPDEGRRETRGDGGGAQDLHPAAGPLLGDGRGYWEAILSNNQGEISQVFQEAHWRQQVAESARRTLDTLYYIFIFIPVCFCLLSVVLLRRAVLGARYLDDCFGLELVVVVLAALDHIYILRCLDQPQTSVSITHRVLPRQILPAACP